MIKVAFITVYKDLRRPKGLLISVQKPDEEQRIRPLFLSAYPNSTKLILKTDPIFCLTPAMALGSVGVRQNTDLGKSLDAYDKGD